MTPVIKSPTNFNEIGGKASGLNLLTQLGYKVPEYFVVSFNQNINSPEFFEQINRLKVHSHSFAVRSSANIEDGENSSFAGQFNSYLNVPTNEVINRIEDVRNSAETENVKSYCLAMGLSVDDIEMNVIIQKFDEPISGGVWMGQSIAGGRLEWVEGRGDKVVNGELIPFYESYDENGILVNKNTEDVLKDELGKSVAEVCKEIQSKLGYNADLEFCITEEGIQWLQLRRVTREIGSSVESKSIPENHNIIVGEAASPYKAQGKAYRLDQRQGAEWKAGEILIARATSPNDMMYIMTSAGVVTKMGGMLSHSAVVCRELGKACVVGIDIEQIQHGDNIIVDGILGKVHLV